MSNLILSSHIAHTLVYSHHTVMISMEKADEMRHTFVRFFLHCKQP